MLSVWLTFTHCVMLDGGKKKKKSSTYVQVFLWSATWLDRCDTSSCWIPDCLETKISAAVGLLVQADPHLTVVLLETRRHRWVEVNFKSPNVGWLPFALEMLVRVGLLWQGSLSLVIYGCWINANLLLYFSYYTKKTLNWNLMSSCIKFYWLLTTKLKIH